MTDSCVLLGKKHYKKWKFLSFTHRNLIQSISHNFPILFPNYKGHTVQELREQIQSMVTEFAGYVGPSQPLKTEWDTNKSLSTIQWHSKYSKVFFLLCEVWCPEFNMLDLFSTTYKILNKSIKIFLT